MAFTLLLVILITSSKVTNDVYIIKLLYNPSLSIKQIIFMFKQSFADLKRRQFHQQLDGFTKHLLTLAHLLPTPGETHHGIDWQEGGEYESCITIQWNLSITVTLGTSCYTEVACL